MNGDDFLIKINDIDDNLIENADLKPAKSAKIKRFAIPSIAASFFLLFVGVLILNNRFLDVLPVEKYEAYEISAESDDNSGSASKQERIEIKNKTEKTSGSENLKSNRNTNKKSSVSTGSKSVDTFSDALGSVAVDGKFFIQHTDTNKSYSKGEFLGRASDFEGYYSDNLAIHGVDGNLYRSAESEEVLLLYLDNGGLVVLVHTETQ